VYGEEDAVEQVAADHDLCQLESYGAGVPNDTSTDLDQTRLQAREGPRGDCELNRSLQHIR
jgi:hypothetical protein